MKRLLVAFSILAVSSAGLILTAHERAAAQENIPGMVAQRCAKEIKEHCKDVTPGDARIDSCLYAHSDKLSYDCAYTMYDASEQLAAIRAALDQMTDETSCRSDISQYCTGVAPEPDLIYYCVKKNFSTLTDGCRAVLPKAEQLLMRAGVIGN